MKMEHAMRAPSREYIEGILDVILEEEPRRIAKWYVGYVMKLTHGAADVHMVQEIVQKRLSE